MKKKTVIYLVRHGETEWNVQNLIQGQTDSPLTQNGIDQAKKVAKELRKVKFDLIFSSDSLRAERTAKIIAAEHKLHIETNKLLRERYFGKLEGQPSKALDAFRELYKEMNDEEIYKNRPTPDSETDEEITTRLITFLRELALSNPGKTALVVTHGAVMRAFLVRLAYKTYNSLGWIGNGAYVKLETDGTNFVIKEIKGIDETHE